MLCLSVVDFQYVCVLFDYVEWCWKLDLFIVGMCRSWYSTCVIWFVTCLDCVGCVWFRNVCMSSVIVSCSGCLEIEMVLLAVVDVCWLCLHV